MTIDANTKIGVLLKENPDSLEAIISISPKFNKLRNPVLRKLMAGRTSIEMASKIGECSVDNFFEKLEVLGFDINRKTTDKEEHAASEKPAFLKNLQPENMLELDVRPIIESGSDPLKLILGKLKSLQPGMVLKLINSFAPTPLIALLEKQGYESFTEEVSQDCTVTYFHQLNNAPPANIPSANKAQDRWEDILARFEKKTKTIDVRSLEMPLPLTTILDALNTLPSDYALFVYHKRIPVFLLPELVERKLDYRIKEINQSEVQLLIFKD